MRAYIPTTLLPFLALVAGCAVNPQPPQPKPGNILFTVRYTNSSDRQDGFRFRAFKILESKPHQPGVDTLIFTDDAELDLQTDKVLTCELPEGDVQTGRWLALYAAKPTYGVLNVRVLCHPSKS